MEVEALTRAEASVACIEALGLDRRWVDVQSTELLAAALRRAASFRCPTTPRQLVASVHRVLDGLVEIDAGLRSRTSDVLEAMVGYGDLLELPDVGENVSPRKLLYLGPPTLVRRQGGVHLLFGIRPDGAPLLGEHLAPTIRYQGHIRSLSPKGGISVETLQREYGLREVPVGQWLRGPSPTSAAELVGVVDARLSTAAPSGDVPGLRILDPTTPTTYYRGRWRMPTYRTSGRFVARRPQLFGADLWCYAEMINGEIGRFVDLPIGSEPIRGCDEAWRLQAAIDATANHPQSIRVARDDAGLDVISFFSPPPSWLQRRLDIVGVPVAARDALVAYAVQPQETKEELSFAVEMLWLQPIDESTRRALHGD